LRRKERKYRKSWFTGVLFADTVEPKWLSSGMSEVVRREPASSRYDFYLAQRASWWTGSHLIPPSLSPRGLTGYGSPLVLRKAEVVSLHQDSNRLRGGLDGIPEPHHLSLLANYEQSPPFSPVRYLTPHIIEFNRSSGLRAGAEETAHEINIRTASSKRHLFHEPRSW
jgi:hypothetical protein